MNAETTPATTTTTARKRSTSTPTAMLAHAMAMIQALVSLIYMLAVPALGPDGKPHAPDQQMVLLLVGTIVANAWPLGETLLRRKGQSRGSALGMLLALGAIDVGSSQTACATQPPTYDALRFTYEPEPGQPAPACIMHIALGDHELVAVHRPDCPPKEGTRP